MPKALSPLIAAVFLIAITLTAAMLVASWVKNFSYRETNVIKQKGENKIACSSAGLVIDNASYNCSSIKFMVEAYNSGTKKLENFKFQVLLANASSYTLNAEPNVSLSPGETKFYYNNSLNISFSAISKLMFRSETCPLTTKNEIESSKITAYGC